MRLIVSRSNDSYNMSSGNSRTMRGTFGANKSAGSNTVGTIGAFAHPGATSHIDMDNDIELDTKARFNASEADLERGAWQDQTRSQSHAYAGRAV